MILPYLIALLLPLGFYFTYQSFQTMRNDTNALIALSSLRNTLNTLPFSDEKEKKINYLKISRDLETLRIWVKTHENSPLYIGGASLKKDFENLVDCWNNCKSALEKNDTRRFIEILHNPASPLSTFSIILESMIKLHQDESANRFYIVFIITLILMLISIYIIRLYIEHLLRKHALRDYETGLYNRQYFDAQYQILCANAKRYKKPLSFLNISILNLLDFQEEERKELLNSFGRIVADDVRSSDIGCRFDSNHIILILPETEVNNVHIVQKRLEEKLNTLLKGFSVQPDFIFNITGFDYEKDSTESCLQRIETFVCQTKFGGKNNAKM
jgi:diguanylate cyclase (GGDEF)-like protein